VGRLEGRDPPAAPAGNTDDGLAAKAIADSTTAGSWNRLKPCKVFKRLARLVKLDGVETLDELRTEYSHQQRVNPKDEAWLELLEQLPPNHHGAWPTWALVTDGYRPAEVFSLTRQRRHGTSAVGATEQERLAMQLGRAARQR
jgi:hypothetical protein